MLLPPSLSGRNLANFMGGVKAKKPIISPHLKDTQELRPAKAMRPWEAAHPKEIRQKVPCSD